MTLMDWLGSKTSTVMLQFNDNHSLGKFSRWRIDDIVLIIPPAYEVCWGVYSCSLLVGPLIGLFICMYVRTVKPRWLEHRWLIYPGWFEFIFESLRNSSHSSRKQIFLVFFLSYHEIVCCVHSLELPWRGNSNEYTQHTIIVYKIEKIIALLLPDLAPWVTLSGSNYPCLE